ncbi:MAG: hypothetical protein PF541_11260, partial [Prolixibacteraceae bacterium]|nr:hypothetical protein [Prolixibacteraceae bacterium]
MLYSMLAKFFLKKANWKDELTKSGNKVVALANSYRWFLSQKKENIPKLQTLEDFKKWVPLSNKQSVFEDKNLNELTRGKTRDVRFVMMSSGSSEKFSIGAFTKKEMKIAAFNTDLFLDLFFGAKKNQTLIINSSSMGVKVFSNHTVSDTGPRTDIVIGLLKSVAIHYDKVFIIGDPIFIKLMVEESLEKNIDWTTINAYFISGGEWMPQTLRDYVHKITGKSAEKPENGFWVGTYGITEIGYPLLFENAVLVSLRSKRKCVKHIVDAKSNNPRFTTPFYFLFRANSFYLEEIEQANFLP